MSRTRDRVRGVFSRQRHAPDDEDEMIEIAGESNAWWVDRPFLDHTVKRSTAAADAGETKNRGGFNAYFSTESLFDHGRTEADGTAHNVFGGAAPSRPDDPFLVLGVRPGASLAEITVRHRQLAKQFHPDLHDDSTRGDAEREMVKINAAYSELRRILRNVERLRVAAT